MHSHACVRTCMGTYMFASMFASMRMCACMSVCANEHMHAESIIVLYTYIRMQHKHKDYIHRNVCFSANLFESGALMRAHVQIF